MRLPRNKAEGDIPKIALVTGVADLFECLLRKIGIDDAEFTADGGNGRVHIYQGENLNVEVRGAGNSPAPTVPGAAPATALWSDLDKMKGYDVVINSCEAYADPAEKPQASLQNFVDYANAGGRSFNTHFQKIWIQNGVTPLPSTAQWAPGLHRTVPLPGGNAAIDTSFPKGEAFADWLVAVGASTSRGQVPIDNYFGNVLAALPPSLQWIYNPASPGAVLHYTFNTPVGQTSDQQCGKVLYSDFHVEVNGPYSQLQATFPAECTSDTMTAKDLSLEFMFFDLSSCIQEDTKPPVVPMTQ
jgi:hypothetical protein